MTDLISKSHSVHPTGQPEARLFDNWIDPIETGVRERVRDWIEALIEAEQEAALGRATSLPSARGAIAMAAGCARSPALSAQPRSRCRGPACTPRMAAPPSGAVQPFGRISGAPKPPMP
jgi:hypothetical protein